jgi:hypothetical protein
MRGPGDQRQIVAGTKQATSRPARASSSHQGITGQKGEQEGQARASVEAMAQPCEPS